MPLKNNTLPDERSGPNFPDFPALVPPIVSYSLVIR